MTTSYALQAMNPSGDWFVVQYDDNIPTWVCGPLDEEERTHAQNHMTYAASFEYEPTTHTEWGFPLAVWDEE